MSDRNPTQIAYRIHGAESDAGRQRQLRSLLLAAANAARQGRRIQLAAKRLGRPLGRAVRDRVTMLLSTAE